jgi:hypothetical protein
VIDVLVPVLGRPQNAQPLADSLRENTTAPVRLLFLASPGDSEEIAAIEAAEADYLVMDFEAGSGDFARKINAGFRATEHPFVLSGADDIEFTPGWDDRVLAAAESGKGVIGTNDQANKHVMAGLFSTHPVIRRSYVLEHGGSLDGPGFVYHEGYDHNYVDRELAHLAQSRDEWIFVSDAVVAHRHPGWNAAITAGETYAKGRRRFHEDHVLFIERAAGWGGVGLLQSEKAWIRNVQMRERHQQRRAGRRRPR